MNKGILYSFGPFLLNPEQMVLSVDGSIVPIPLKALKTLLTLIEHGGQVVSKQELIEAVWPDSYVEEGNLTQNIFLLRRQLGKAPEGQDYIETIPRRGYRLTVPIRKVPAPVVEGLGDDKGVSGQQRPGEGLDLEEHPDVPRNGNARTGVLQRRLLTAVPVLVLALLSWVAVEQWHEVSYRPRFSGFSQITRDGLSKRVSMGQRGGPDAAIVRTETGSTSARAQQMPLESARFQFPEAIQRVSRFLLACPPCSTSPLRARNSLFQTRLNLPPPRHSGRFPCRQAWPVPSLTSPRPMHPGLPMGAGWHTCEAGSYSWLTEMARDRSFYPICRGTAGIHAGLPTAKSCALPSSPPQARCGKSRATGADCIRCYVEQGGECFKGIRLTGVLAGLEFGLTPQGNPVITHDIGIQEVYSLNWNRPQAADSGMPR